MQNLQKWYKIPDLAGLLIKTNLNTKVTNIENKKPHAADFFKKTYLDTKISPAITNVATKNNKTTTLDYIMADRKKQIFWIVC